MNVELFGFMSFLFSSLCFLPFFILGAALTIFWVWMLIDCLTNETNEGNEKLIWCLVIVFLHGLGAFLYLLVRRPQRKRDIGR